jgi:hypothetical protein
MLKDIIKKIDSIIPSLFPVDASQFNDPVALQTEWKGVRSGKSSGPSAKLVQKDANLLAYKPSILGQVMGVIFFLAGALVIWMYFSLPGDKPWFILLIGPLFVLVGIIIIFQATSPVAFDKSAGLFYKGRRQQRLADATDIKHAARFSDIHAIQLLTRLESSSDNNTPTRYYRVYEMNLVKHDGQRIHVMTYGKVTKARDDARTIAEFVKVPVWDGTDG